MTGVFVLDGQQFMCLDGGPQFEMSGAISFLVEFETQEELDEVWARLTDGGKALQCGWVTNKFGVTWQITPTALGKMMSDASATPEQKQALMKAMMPIVKLDVAMSKVALEGAKPR